MDEPGWWTYLKLVAGTEDGQTIAEAAGVTPPQVSRWKSGKNRPDADKLARFARHYQRPPVEAFIAAGYLSKTEALQVVEIVRPVDAMSDEELINEVRNRMKGARRGVESEEESPAQGEEVKAEKIDDSGERPEHGLGRTLDAEVPAELEVDSSGDSVS